MRRYPGTGQGVTGAGTQGTRGRNTGHKRAEDRSQGVTRGHKGAEFCSPLQRRRYRRSSRIRGHAHLACCDGVSAIPLPCPLPRWESDEGDGKVEQPPRLVLPNMTRAMSCRHLDCFHPLQGLVSSCSARFGFCFWTFVPFQHLTPRNFSTMVRGPPLHLSFADCWRGGEVRRQERA